MALVWKDGTLLWQRKDTPGVYSNTDCAYALAFNAAPCTCCKCPCDCTACNFSAWTFTITGTTTRTNCAGSWQMVLSGPTSMVGAAYPCALSAGPRLSALTLPAPCGDGIYTDNNPCDCIGSDYFADPATAIAHSSASVFIYCTKDGTCGGDAGKKRWVMVVNTAGCWAGASCNSVPGNTNGQASATYYVITDADCPPTSGWTNCGTPTGDDTITSVSISGGSGLIRPSIDAPTPTPPLMSIRPKSEAKCGGCRRNAPADQPNHL